MMQRWACGRSKELSTTLQHGLLASMLVVCFSMGGHGQVEYHFRITDSETHAQLDSVYLFFPHLGRKYLTDAHGRLQLTGPLAAGDTVHIQRDGYEKKSLPLPESNNLFVKLVRSPVPLRDIEIVAYTQETRYFEAPQTIGTLRADDFERNTAASIQPTMNTIPGVLMESRGAGGSRRLSIRGSLMRSPFGVRNLKVYWNEFPLTIADGSTGLELIDPEEIGQVDVLKGPQGSVYGEGHGGAALFRSAMAPYGQLRASANLQAGAYGMQKQTFQFTTSSKKTAVKVNYFRYRHAGYREQEAVRKDQFNLLTRFRPSANREIKLFALYYDGAWELPGGLDSLTAVTAPRSARPFAVENDTRVARKWFRTGISNKVYFADRFYNYSAAFLHSTSKLNPYGTNAFYNGYKDEGANGWGLRTILGYEFDTDEAGIHLMLGGEYQRDLNALAEYDLVDADFGDLRLSEETQSQYVNAFFKAETHLNRKLVVDASLGLLTTWYNRDDLLADTTADRSLNKTFAPVLLPKIGIRYTLSNRYVIYALASRGVSTPTLWEIQDAPDLDPERSDHFELGVRSSLFKDQVLITLNGYTTRITNAITEQPDALGFSTYDNSGSVELRGVESTITYDYKGKPNAVLSALRLSFNLGIQSYKFDALTIQNEDYGGNALPGVPLLTYALTADIAMGDRLKWRISYRFFDAVPLDFANAHYSAEYDLLDMRVEYRLRFLDRFAIDLYAGAENLLDEQYASFFRLNAVDGRFYNPQAPRTLYGGLRLTFEKPIKLIR